MSATACHEPLNGPKPRCVRDSDFDRINDRLDAAEERAGELVREVSLARSEAQAAHAIGRKVLDEVLGMRGEMRESEDRRNRECDIRHRPIERRLDRLEDHDDTLTATSSVTYSDEALRKRYEERKSEISGLHNRMQNLEQRLAGESKAKTEALEAEAIARSRARTAMWGAAGLLAMAVASAVVAALQTWR